MWKMAEQYVEAHKVSITDKSKTLHLKLKPVMVDQKQESTNGDRRLTDRKKRCCVCYKMEHIAKECKSIFSNQQQKSQHKAAGAVYKDSAGK